MTGWALTASLWALCRLPKRPPTVRNARRACGGLKRHPSQRTRRPRTHPCQPRRCKQKHQLCMPLHLCLPQGGLTPPPRRHRQPLTSLALQPVWQLGSGASQPVTRQPPPSLRLRHLRPPPPLHRPPRASRCGGAFGGCSAWQGVVGGGRQPKPRLKVCRWALHPPSRRRRGTLAGARNGRALGTSSVTRETPRLSWQFHCRSNLCTWDTTQCRRVWAHPRRVPPLLLLLSHHVLGRERTAHRQRTS